MFNDVIITNKWQNPKDKSRINIFKALNYKFSKFT